MAKQAEVEGKKSILGRLGSDRVETKGKDNENLSTQEAAEDLARQNLLRRIKEMRLFTLDEPDYKLKSADWLKYVCWQPHVHDEIKRQNNRLSNHIDNPLDKLLVSAFELVDVNEAGAVNKILEDAATAHVRQVREYFER